MADNTYKIIQDEERLQVLNNALEFDGTSPTQEPVTSGFGARAPSVELHKESKSNR